MMEKNVETAIRGAQDYEYVPPVLCRQEAHVASNSKAYRRW